MGPPHPLVLRRLVLVNRVDPIITVDKIAGVTGFGRCQAGVVAAAGVATVGASGLHTSWARAQRAAALHMW